MNNNKRLRKPSLPHTRRPVFLSHNRTGSRIGDEVVAGGKDAARHFDRRPVHGVRRVTGLRKSFCLPTFERHPAARAGQHRKYGRDNDDPPRLVARRSVALSDANSTRSNTCRLPLSPPTLPPAFCYSYSCATDYSLALDFSTTPPSQRV